MPDLVPIATPASSSVRKSKEHPSSVPVSIISGFLGSGKTTFVSHVLQNAENLKVAVIMNELAEDTLGIDQNMVLTAQGEKYEDWLELRNGCVCCAVKDDMVTALETLLAKGKHFDHILLETTGLANPGPVAATFWLDEALESSVKLNGVMVLVDAAHACMVENTMEFQSQIASADVILVNKIDLLPDKLGRGLEDITSLVQGMNPLATVVPTTNSVVPSLSILFQMATLENAEALRRGLGELHHANGGVHTKVVTVTMTGGRVRRHNLLRWLTEVAERHTVYRMKGIVALDDDDSAGEKPTKCILQGVHQTFDIFSSCDWEEMESVSTRIVFIGLELPEAELQESFTESVN